MSKYITFTNGLLTNVSGSQINVTSSSNPSNYVDLVSSGSSYISMGHDTSLSDLDFSDFTFEGYFNLKTNTNLPTNEQDTGYIAFKATPTTPVFFGWYIKYDRQNGGANDGDVYLNFQSSTKFHHPTLGDKLQIGTIGSGSAVPMPRNNILNNWHHFAVSGSHTISGSKTVDMSRHFYIDGLESPSFNTSVAYYTDSGLTDASEDLTIGRYHVITYPTYIDKSSDIEVGWMRLSSSERYSGSFIPNDMNTPPSSDANTIAVWPVNEGTGTVLDNAEGTSTRDGNIVSGSWAVGSQGSSSLGARKYTFVNGLLTNVSNVIPGLAPQQGKMTFINGLLTSASLTYVSSSGSSVVPPITGGDWLTLTIWDTGLFNFEFTAPHTIRHPGNGTYLGNGLMQMVHISTYGSQYCTFVFKGDMNAPAGTRFSKNIFVDIEHLSGTFDSGFANPNMRIDGTKSQIYGFADPGTINGLTLYQGTLYLGTLPPLGRATLSNTNTSGFYWSDVDSKWFAVTFDYDDITTTCQYQIHNIWFQDYYTGQLILVWTKS